MKVMKRAVIEWQDTKPLPGEITTARVHIATLPVKIETARRAIAACTDLPELLRYQNDAEAIAAAVRIMSDVAPEVVKSANRMVKEAIVQLGCLLLAYSSAARIAVGPPSPLEGNKRRKGHTRPIVLSERAVIAEAHKIPRGLAQNSVRVAAAEPLVRARILKDDGIRATGSAMASACRPIDRTTPSNVAYWNVMHGGYTSNGRGNSGLSRMLEIAQAIPLKDFQKLDNEHERGYVKKKLTALVELLDEMDRLCK
jgi:hypothetical protein